MKKLPLFFEYKLILIFIILTAVAGCSSGKNAADDLFTSGNYEKAALEYEKIVANNPQNWKAYMKLGECYINMNRIELAFDAYDTALKLNPNLNNIKDNIKEIQLNISEKFLSEKKYRKAYKILDKIIETDPNNIDANYQLALLYKETDRPGKAKIYFNKIIKIDPDNKEVLDELKLISERKKEAEKYFRKGKGLYDYEIYYEAYEKFRKSVELKPDYKDAKYYMHLALGRDYLKKDDLGVLWNAIAEFGSAMEVYPERAEHHYLMGLAYEKKDKKDYKTPIEEYKKAIELEPESKIAKLCRERIKRFYKDKKKIEKMEKFWRKKK